MSSESEDGKTRRRGVGRLVSAFSLSYLFGAFLLVSLFYAFGTWDVLAGSRFLDLLIRVGIVKYHDQNLGFIEGVADHKYYLTSQTPVDWLLVVFAGLLFLAFFAVKTLQFDGRHVTSGRRERSVNTGAPTYTASDWTGGSPSVWVESARTRR